MEDPKLAGLFTSFPLHYGPPPSFATYCNVLSRVLRSARFITTNYVSYFRRDCRGRFLNYQKNCHGVHGYHGLLRLPIPFQYVASRLSRFVHGGLKRGCRGRREHSVNAVLGAVKERANNRDRLWISVSFVSASVTNRLITTTGSYRYRNTT